MAAEAVLLQVSVTQQNTSDSRSENPPQGRFVQMLLSYGSLKQQGHLQWTFGRDLLLAIQDLKPVKGPFGRSPYSPA